MPMSKKQYELLANALAKSKPPSVGNETSAHDEQWAKDVDAIADALGDDNPRFDKERFTDWIMHGGARPGK